MITASRSNGSSPWTNVYGVARSLIALCTLVGLACDTSNDLFRPLGEESVSATNDFFARHVSLFGLLGGPHLEWARWIAVLILLVVASGWRPRVTALLHCWVAMSFATSAILVEGGDQLANNLAVLMLPIALMDGRRWHWGTPVPVTSTLGSQLRRTVALSCFTVIRVQMAFVYLHAAVGKTGVREWVDGTALYYWFNNPTFGMPDHLRPFLDPLLSSEIGVLCMTWGVLAMEFLLSSALVMERRYWRVLLVAGLLFHAGIVVVHGLASFFFTMAGGLILYLRPCDEPFAFNRHRASFGALREREGAELPTMEAA